MGLVLEDKKPEELAPEQYAALMKSRETMLRQMVGDMLLGLTSGPIRIATKDIFGSTGAKIVRGNFAKDFVETSEGVIDRMLERALRGRTGLGKTLEPAAGKGAIAKKALPYASKMEVLELDPRRAKYLKKLGFDVVGQDFYSHTGKYDTILMNPPFSGGQAKEFIARALDMLNPSGRLIAVTPNFVRNPSRPSTKAFLKWLNENQGTLEHMTIKSPNVSGGRYHGNLITILKAAE